MRKFMYILLALAAVSVRAGDKKTAKAEKPPMPIVIDTEAQPIKDLRENRAGTGLGFAGSMLELGGDTCSWLFISNCTETARIFRDAGVCLVRNNGGARLWQAGMAWAQPENRALMRKNFRQTPLIDAETVYSFWKENGIRVIVCLSSRDVFSDVPNATSTNDLDAVCRVIGAYVKWIVDQGYTDVIVGFEMDNEPFFGNEPEKYAARWRAIIPEIKRAWPGAQIGWV